MSKSTETVKDFLMRTAWPPWLLCAALAFSFSAFQHFSVSLA
jgi:hypothetical protein